MSLGGFFPSPLPSPLSPDEASEDWVNLQLSLVVTCLYADRILFQFLKTYTPWESSLRTFLGSLSWVVPLRIKLAAKVF